MRIFPPGENYEMSRKIGDSRDIRDDLATRKFNRLGFLLSGRPEVQILLATSEKIPKILTFTGRIYTMESGSAWDPMENQKW